MIRLSFHINLRGDRLPVTVTYPDLFPFFRPEVQAHGAGLDHHHHPFG